MKLSDYAKQQGVRYETAWRWFRDGKIKGHRVGKHTVMIDEGQAAPAAPTRQKVAIYARVSSAEQRDNLEQQAERLVAYGTAKGYQITQVVKEIGSGVNDARPKFLALLEDPSIGILIIEHQDRASRFGFRYIKSLFRVQGRMLEVVNQGENDKEDLLHDLASILYSFCARLYGQRRAKRKTAMIVQQLQAEKGEEDATR